MLEIIVVLILLGYFCLITSRETSDVVPKNKFQKQVENSSLVLLNPGKIQPNFYLLYLDL